MVTLKNTRQFNKVYRQGKSFATKYMVIYVLNNRSLTNRLGFSVSKKVGNSVKRSRITRLLKEGYRRLEKTVTSGFDIVMIARKPMDTASFQDVLNSIDFLLRKHNLFIG